MKRRTQTRSNSARDERRKNAEQMNAAWRELTPSQQLAALDARLGKGVGAKRQRARLTPKVILASMSPEEANAEVIETSVPTEKTAKKDKREAKSRKGGKK